MSSARSLSLFAVALAVLFGAGAAAGRVLDPGAPGAGSEARAGGHPGRAMSGMDEREMAADPVRRPGVAENDVRLVLDGPDLTARRTGRVRFRIVDRAGRPLNDFDAEPNGRMHIIVVRRDLTGFQHRHPRMAADGTWTAPLRVAAPGSYRMFADFTRNGKATTLAGDLDVDGPAS